MEEGSDCLEAPDSYSESDNINGLRSVLGSSVGDEEATEPVDSRLGFLDGVLL